MTNVIPLNPPSPRLYVVEQSPAGQHEFNDADRDRVEITAGLNKVWAVRVGGVIWAEFNVHTLAIRCKELLDGLDRLGALPHPESPTLRSMMARCPELGGDCA